MFRLISQALLVVVLMTGAALRASEYPVGDILPEVIVHDGRFEVYSTTWRVSDGSPWNKVYRTVFSADGKLITGREPFVGKIPQRDVFYSEMDCREGRPNFIYAPTIHEHMQVITLQLPPGAYTDCVALGWLSPEKFVMRDSPAKGGKDGEWPFSLRIFNWHSGEVLASTLIGTCGRIYDIATTSPVLSMGDDLLIAWMEQKHYPDVELPGGGGAARDSAFRVVLTRWQPKLGKTQHTVVAPAIDDNVAISIGRIGEVVFVAWHERGKIRTRAVDLRTARFVSRLPELQHDQKQERSVLQEISVLPPAK